MMPTQPQFGADDDMTDPREHFNWKTRLCIGLSLVPIVVITFLSGQHSRQLAATILFRVSSAGLLALCLSWIFEAHDRYRWVFVGAGAALILAGLLLYLSLK
jgi:hypothetical protein